MEIANVISKESNCVSLQVGCVIVRDKRVISMGYNGTVAGAVNCNVACGILFDRAKHRDWSSSHEVHAEMNALMYAAKNGTAVDGGTLYCTSEPCDQCLKNIIAAGIERIVYKRPYDKKMCKSIYRTNGTIKIEQLK